MMFIFWVGWVVVCLLLNLSHQNDNLNKNEFNNLLYQRKGNVSIIGIFKDRFGSDCNREVEKGLEEIASAIWTVETLNKYQYIPGITIGLTIFGICENSINQTISLDIEQHLRLNRDIDYIGILTSLEIYNNILALQSTLKNDIVHIEHVINTNIITDAVVQLLMNLQWMRVNTVISDSADTLRLFREKTSEEGIVTHDELLMNSSSSCSNLINSKKIKISSVIVMIASFANIAHIILSSLSQKISDRNIKLILTPTDFIFDASLLDLPKDTIVSLPSMENKTTLSKYIKTSFRLKKIFNYKHPQSPLFVGTAASILKLLKPFKNVLEKNCENTELHLEQLCASVAYFISKVLGNKTALLSQKSMKISPDDVEETLKVLKIEPSSNDEMFLYISSVINDNSSEDLAIFNIFSLKTKKFQPVLAMINDNSLTTHEILNNSEINKTEYFSRILKPNIKETDMFPNLGDPIFNLLQKVPSLENLKTVNEKFEDNNSLKHSPKKSCAQSQMCLDLAINYTSENQNNVTTEKNSEVAWRFLAWVSINTSLGFVGVTCTVSTMLFLITRLCKRDILYGAPYFTLLLMISVILTYISALPFHMKFPSDDEFICIYRQYAPPIVFAVLFSLLLSRSILLAFEEKGEQLTGHINGYVQSILCIFIFGTQVSIITQNWVFESNLSCGDVYDKYRIFFSLGYNFLLLMLLSCVSPFIIRSKQNYKEGLLFSITVFFITVVWSAWISFYILLPNEHKDAAIAVGLNSTASVFLFCIFIPQTYFMAAPFDQEMALRSLSSLGRNILSDVNFKSKQALNESAFGTIMYNNCETGLSNPNFLTSCSNENDNSMRTGDFVREADIQLSPEAP